MLGLVLLCSVIHQSGRPQMDSLAVCEFTGEVAVSYSAEGISYLEIYAPDGTLKDRHVFHQTGSEVHGLRFDADGGLYALIGKQGALAYYDADGERHDLPENSECTAFIREQAYTTAWDIDGSCYIRTVGDRVYGYDYADLFELLLNRRETVYIEISDGMVVTIWASDRAGES